MIFGQPGEQRLALQVRSVLEHAREFGRQAILHGKAAANDPGAIFWRGEQRYPVVVEVADVLVGDVVDALTQVAIHPRMLWALHRTEKRVFDPAARGGVGRPEPVLPKAFD